MFILEIIGEIGYFTISFYFTYAIAALVLPLFLIRLIRAFPYYVKHGNLGTADNTIWLGDDKRELRVIIRDYFVETHPGAIGGDIVLTLLFMILLHICWGFVPIVILGYLIWVSVGKLATHMREQHLKKQEFHAALKGD